MGGDAPALRKMSTVLAGTLLMRHIAGGGTARARNAAGKTEQRCVMRRGWFGFGFVFASILILPAVSQGAEYKVKLPLGLQEQAAYIPGNNPLTPEKIALGKQFFWDKRWSFSGTVACVSCHQPDHGWSDPRQFSTHANGKPTPRHPATIINRLFSDRQLWTGLRPSLEEQAGKDSNRTDEEIVKKLGAIPAYQQQFRKVFGTDLNAEGIAKAISAYVRTILSGNSRYDRFLAGNMHALSPAARRGLGHFEGRSHGQGCIRCHAGFNFTDEGYHNIGIAMDRGNPDLGRYTVTKKEADKGAFKTPTLRDVAKRPPYMHDGSLKSLEEVVAFYNKGGHSNPWISAAIQPLNLTASQQADLVAFLEALTGEVAPEVSNPPKLPQ
jgi:cytochrome c peroxidase